MKALGDVTGEALCWKSDVIEDDVCRSRNQEAREVGDIRKVAALGRKLVRLAWRETQAWPHRKYILNEARGEEECKER